MSTTGTYRGTQSHRTAGRGKLPDFENNSSHIPRPPSSATAHTPASDVGSSTMSAASSRQRQNQSKRDEVCSLFGFGSLLVGNGDGGGSDDHEQWGWVRAAEAYERLHL